MSEEREKRQPAETDGDREKLPADVEAHKLAGRMAETEEKRDKISETDDADVEGHMMRQKLSPPKMDA